MIVAYLHGLGAAWVMYQAVRQWLRLFFVQQTNSIKVEYSTKSNSRSARTWTAIPVKDPSESYGGVVWSIVHGSVASGGRLGCPSNVPIKHRQMLRTHNMLATENVTVTELWATTFVPTSPSVSASVMLVAPQHCGHFLPLRSNTIDANAVQFSAEGRIFLLAFHDSAMFWCFKYMVHCRDYVDRNRHHTPELNAKILLDAFLDFKIPAEVPLGVRGAVQGCTYFSTAFNQAEHTFPVSKSLTCLSSHGLPKYHDKAGFNIGSSRGSHSFGNTLHHSLQQAKAGNSHEDANGRLDLPQSRSTAVDDSTGGTGERIPRPIDPDIRPVVDTLLATFNSLHTPRSQSIAMGDNAGGASEPNPDLIILEDRPAVDVLLSLSATDQGASQLTVIGQRRSLLLAPINLANGAYQLLDEVLMVLEQERQGNTQGYYTVKLTPVDTSDNTLELKLLELKFRMAVTTSIVLVVLIWMIILAAQFICDGNDLLANMSWKSISFASSMIFVLLLTVL
ncbi:hypothetical protein EDC04DRAFT_2609206 [Pisolithus marmoratus]|nr:hypothetical protein EDC04DRAFT_2609206 [Pisolithus marmoratus]